MGLISRFGTFSSILVLASCSSLRREEPTKNSAMEQAAQAWQQLSEVGTDEKALARYRGGVAQVIAEMCEQASPERWPATVRLQDGSVVKVDAGAPGRHEVWTPRLFDELKQAVHQHPSAISDGMREGIGLPLDGLRVDSREDKHSRFVYDRKQHLPVTAVLEFAGDGSNTKQATLHLYDPREVQKTKVGSHSIALAADFVAPVHEVLDRRSFVRRALYGLLRPGRFMNDEGLFIQEPYRADKIPVIFVHGLMSDPHIWENEVVALMSDPVIGKRVQCWCFMYPSGLPVPVSAARLRKSLEDAMKTFNPSNTDPGMKNTILVGHSMGGLLSRMQVINSEDKFWNTWFTAPPDKVPLDGEASRVMRASLLFKANPDVKRVIFIATPHKGSELADSWIARMAARLIHAPLDLVQVVTSIATLDVEFINPARLEMSRMGANSITGLSAKHPVLQAIAQQPLNAPCDSIIAVIKDKPKLDETSDGVVPYVSSHLDQAKSETTVKSGHSCTAKIGTVNAVRDAVRKQVQLLP